MFTEKDLDQFETLGIPSSLIEEQIKNFENGFPFMTIKAPATIGHGIIKLEDQQLDEAVAYFEQRTSEKDIVKFVPASGAASRMFKHLFAFMKSYDASEEAYHALQEDQSFHSVFNFFKHLDEFAFYNSLKKVAKGEALETMHLKKEYSQILEHLLTEKGLNYGDLPKGLLEFHAYENDSRTPLEEHLVEAAHYAKGNGSVAKLHFTVSPEHESKFKEKLSEVQAVFEKQFDVRFEVSFSQQKKSTDTIAVDLQNLPFRNGSDRILFRPGGHGALIHNLNDIDADIVFVKNIDNVVPDGMKPITYRYKKGLAGLLLQYQEKIFQYLQDLEVDESEEKVKEVTDFVEQEIGVIHGGFASLPLSSKIDCLKYKLNRPIRVCGMVKNEGEPGGGPFWAVNPDKSVSLQIVESAQLNMNDHITAEQVAKATHFNPVDLVCGLKDKDGKRFDLMSFKDDKTGFISKKSKDGKDLKAQELPGLWNGAMSDWNTIFVEVPIETFNPVKTVNDLLRPEHQ